MGAPGTIGVISEAFCVQVVVESMEVGKLVLYPQITLTTLGLLTTSHVHLHALNLGLFSKVCFVHCSRPFFCLLFVCFSLLQDLSIPSVVMTL